MRSVLLALLLAPAAHANQSILPESITVEQDAQTRATAISEDFSYIVSHLQSVANKPGTVVSGSGNIHVGGTPSNPIISFFGQIPESQVTNLVQDLQELRDEFAPFAGQAFLPLTAGTAFPLTGELLVNSNEVVNFPSSLLFTYGQFLSQNPRGNIDVPFNPAVPTALAFNSATHSFLVVGSYPTSGVSGYVWSVNDSTSVGTITPGNYGCAQPYITGAGCHFPPSYFGRVVVGGVNGWAADAGSNSLDEIFSFGPVVNIPLIFSNGEASGVAYDPGNGNVWVTRGTGGNLVVVSTQSPGVQTGIATNETSIGITFDGTDMWTTSGGTGYVSRYSTSTLGSQTTYYLNGEHPGPITSCAGAIWTGNSDNTVDKIYQSPLGIVIQNFPLQGQDPYDMACDNAGNVWVADFSSDEVEVVSSTGGVLNVIHVGGGPDGIATDGQNMWVISETSSTITEIPDQYIDVALRVNGSEYVSGSMFAGIYGGNGSGLYNIFYATESVNGSMVPGGVGTVSNPIGVNGSSVPIYGPSQNLVLPASLTVSPIITSTITGGGSLSFDAYSVSGSTAGIQFNFASQTYPFWNVSSLAMSSYSVTFPLPVNFSSSVVVQSSVSVYGSVTSSTVFSATGTFTNSLTAATGTFISVAAGEYQGDISNVMGADRALALTMTPGYLKGSYSCGPLGTSTATASMYVLGSELYCAAGLGFAGLNTNTGAFVSSCTIGEQVTSITSDGTNLFTTYSGVVKINPATCSEAWTYTPQTNEFVNGNSAYDGSSLWVAENIHAGGSFVGIVQLNATTGAVISSTPFTNAPSEVVFDGSHIWTTVENFGVVEMNLSNVIIGTVTFNSDGSSTLYFDGTNLWATQTGVSGVGPELVEISTGSLTVTRTLSFFGFEGSADGGVVSDGTDLWVSGHGYYSYPYYLTGMLAEVSLSNGVSVATFTQTAGTSIVFDGASLWVNAVSTSVGSLPYFPPVLAGVSKIADFSSSTAPNSGTTGVSSACASGYYWNAGTWQNGVQTGGACAAVPTVPLNAVYFVPLYDSSGFAYWETVDPDATVRTSLDFYSSIPASAVPMTDSGGNYWILSVDTDGTLRTVASTYSAFAVSSVIIWASNAVPYIITIETDGTLRSTYD